MFKLYSSILSLSIQFYHFFKNDKIEVIMIKLKKPENLQDIFLIDLFRLFKSLYDHMLRKSFC